VTSTHPRPDASDLDPDAYNLWLDPSVKDDGAASELLKPFNARLMRCYLGASGSIMWRMIMRNVLAPVEPAETQNTLFESRSKPAEIH